MVMYQKGSYGDLTTVPGLSDALAFAHGHIFRVIAARWIELPASGGARLTLKAGAVCALGFERDTQVIALWNQTPA